jgi:hypothetical protein
MLDLPLGTHIPLTSNDPLLNLRVVNVKQLAAIIQINDIA